MLADLTVKDFLDKVACSDPVPGGGSIAALDGALASALSTMVARLTVGKKGYEASEEVMQHAQTITLRLLDEFIALIDKDSAALVPLEVARKALDMMSVIADVARLGNRNAVTDACVAMMAARSAVLGALLNVRINLGSLKDRDFVLQLQTEADTIEQTACRREKELLDAVNQDLRV